ncbi:MAG TPA: hypothetical protein VG734_11140 [Lacunisphaera sp.]|nr:hypothetical protein [Lacunisphaera sp.]
MTSLRQAAFGSSLVPFELVEGLIAAAVAADREARQARARSRPRPRRPSHTLRPGPQTPLWNELVKQIRPHLRKHGAKAQLARLMGLPRQRLHDCLKAGSASFDAERTLQLLGWLGFFQRGGEIAPVVRPGRPPAKTAPALPGNV